MGTDLRLTTSWDDGHPADMRLAERLAYHGIRATFYVPTTNSEGRPVMPAADLRQLDAAGFELAAHTQDHRRLRGLTLAEARCQIQSGKDWLEDCLGHAVVGFAYPGGHAGRWGRQLCEETGFAYARTTCMFALSPGPDRYAMATTVQFFPHRPWALLRNWARRGGGMSRLALALQYSRAQDCEAGVAAVADTARAHGGVFHLWGHSWEVEELALWALLDRVLANLAANIPPNNRLHNAALWSD
jgi:peptidoglycan-N-acetylglucosamine deacetylase